MKLIEVGARVVVDNLGEGVVTRWATNPKWPDDPDGAVYEVEVHGWFWKRKYWRTVTYIKLIQDGDKS